jgi:hypothetical protein
MPREKARPIVITGDISREVRQAARRYRISAKHLARAAIRAFLDTHPAGKGLSGKDFSGKGNTSQLGIRITRGDIKKLKQAAERRDMLVNDYLIAATAFYQRAIKEEMLFDEPLPGKPRYNIPEPGHKRRVQYSFRIPPETHTYIKEGAARRKIAIRSFIAQITDAYETLSPS